MPVRRAEQAEFQQQREQMAAVAAGATGETLTTKPHTLARRAVLEHNSQQTS